MDNHVIYSKKSTDLIFHLIVAMASNEKSRAWSKDECKSDSSNWSREFDSKTNLGYV